MNDVQISVVSNKIILSRSNFSAFHKKILSVIVDTISPNILQELNLHKDKKTVEKLQLTSRGLEKSYQLGAFDISTIIYKASDICRADQYEELREALTQLRKKDFVINNDAEHYESSLILKFKFDKRSEYLSLGVDEELYRFVFDLTQGYTLYQTKVVLSLGSIYAIRIYELIAKWRNKPMFYISIEDLRLFTNTVEKYSQTRDLKIYVLDIAKQQLDASEITDLTFDYSDKKEGKKVVGFDIYIHKTEFAHDLPSKKLQQPSLHWDFSKDMIDNFKMFGIVGLSGKNLETVKALQVLLGEKKLALEIQRIYSYAHDKPNPMGYIIKSLKNALTDKKTEPADMTPAERKKHAENARKLEPTAFGDLFNEYKK